ncbi:MAG: Gfo/Idh/MocA family oxidoreductase [Rhodospirillaceae bacterium]|jgi:predicted dehydrogenase|nr:Gfo/Idh/MocA family oxidoreductase [Rhodospirillaceae bacterium]MBT4686890.1 Gfo/Idh/MocA family oxidoreductase [Rhodospirillaceae bacterium]MBT5081864.1 Gfo/Idh/MocA family oxidoreductase [Rhodospirillaceae bacterium]MBT5524898.1 Gfo/Idh/MocA family oxidoreductase [Rhodospirillaceae bacterium]MBT5881363.1 Gfo/Idh/MocA family oxidoreductase [Rhodospirillaceae bacterium]
MSKPKVRTGIVGAGFAASFHIEAARRVHGADVDVIGVHARTAASTQKYADTHGIAAFADLDALLEKIDVLHVCIPPALHEAVAIKALEQDVFAIVEKPLTGYFGDGTKGFDGRTASMAEARTGALDSVSRMLAAENSSKGRILYAENWVYAPTIQKEREILEKTKGQILWMHGEEAHSGSHAPSYGHWNLAGGGAMIGKGCHPLTAALYLKGVEGRARFGKPIRPATVTARTHALTQLPEFVDTGHIRADYVDIEDFAMTHVTFQDGTVATVFASDIVLGGVHNWLEVCAGNHRTICNLNPSNQLQTYNPVESQFDDIYVVEKIGTKQGWAMTAPDEDFSHGFPQEIEAFYRAVAHGDTVESNSLLAADCISTIYSGYVSAADGGMEEAVTLVEAV